MNGGKYGWQEKRRRGHTQKAKTKEKSSRERETRIHVQAKTENHRLRETGRRRKAERVIEKYSRSSVYLPFSAISTFLLLLVMATALKRTRRRRDNTR